MAIRTPTICPGQRWPWAATEPASNPSKVCTEVFSFASFTISIGSRSQRTIKRLLFVILKRSEESLFLATEIRNEAALRSE